MYAFKYTIISSINKKHFTRSYYLGFIDFCLTKKYITQDEANECLVVLDEVYPVTD